MPSIRRTRVRAPADAAFAEHGEVFGEALNDSGRRLPTAAANGGARLCQQRRDPLNSPALATNNDRDKSDYFLAALNAGGSCAGGESSRSVSCGLTDAISQSRNRATFGSFSLASGVTT